MTSSEIHWTSAGAGETLVFVHGWTCDSTSWDAQVAHFAERYRVVALDLPGYGRSPMSDDGTSIDGYARSVEQVRRELGSPQITLIGHSMGALVVGRFARLHPSAVTALIGVDGPLDPRVVPVDLGLKKMELTGAAGADDRRRFVESLFTDETPDDVRRRVSDVMLGASDEVAIAGRDAILEVLGDRDGPVDVPTLVVYGGATAPDDVATMREVFPRYEFDQLPGTGHFLMMEQPREFNAIVDRFLDAR